MQVICCEKVASAAANKKCRQWNVRQVLSIDGIFAERCIYYLLTTNCGREKAASAAANELSRQ